MYQIESWDWSGAGNFNPTLTCHQYLSEEGVMDFLRDRKELNPEDNIYHHDLLETQGGAFVALRAAILELQRIVPADYFPNQFIEVRSRELLAQWDADFADERSFAIMDFLAYYYNARISKVICL